MLRAAESIALPVLFLLGLAACGTGEIVEPATPDPASSGEAEEAVVEETEPETEPASTDVPDYPEREVKPEEEWASNYLFASEMANMGQYYFDSYEYHPLVGWEPDESAVLEEPGKSYSVCSYSELYWGYFYMDQPVETFTSYSSEETDLDDVVVQYTADKGYTGIQNIIVNIPITCGSWQLIVDQYGANPNITPKQVLLSEENAYAIADIDALAEREIRDSHENNPLDIRDTERDYQTYYKFSVPSE